MTDDDDTPQLHLAPKHQVIDRLDDLERIAVSLMAARKRFHRYILAAAIAAAGSVGTLAINVLHRAESDAAERQRLINVERAIEELRLDIRELRGRHSDASGPESTIFVEPDRLSLRREAASCVRPLS